MSNEDEYPDIEDMPVVPSSQITASTNYDDDDVDASSFKIYEVKCWHILMKFQPRGYISIYDLVDSLW